MSFANAPAARTSLLICNLDPHLKLALCRRAAAFGASVEAAARSILADAVVEFVEPEMGLPVSLGAAMTTLFGKDGGVDLDLPPREMGCAPPDLSGSGAT